MKRQVKCLRCNESSLREYMYKYDGRLFLFISFKRYIHTVIVITYLWTGLVWKHQESFSDWF